MVRDVEQLLPEGNVPWAQRLLLRNTLQVLHHNLFLSLSLSLSLVLSRSVSIFRVPVLSFSVSLVLSFSLFSLVYVLRARGRVL